MTIIEGIRKWLQTYEGLSEGRINVDFLPEDAKTYSVDSVPAKEVIKQYLDGSTQRQFLFCISSREFYGEDIGQNTDNHSFFEALSTWLDEQRRKRTFPIIGDGRKVMSIDINSTAYPFVVDENGTARYQIQLNMIYYQKGART